MTLIENISPDSVYILISISLTGLILSYFIGMFGTLANIISPKIKRIVRSGSFVLFLIGIWLLGALYVSDIWKQRMDQQRIEMLEQQLQTSKENEQLINKLHATKGKIEEIRNENKKYIEEYLKKYDSICTIPIDVVRLHNNSARNIPTKHP